MSYLRYNWRKRSCLFKRANCYHVTSSTAVSLTTALKINSLPPHNLLHS